MNFIVDIVYLLILLFFCFCFIGGYILESYFENNGSSQAETTKKMVKITKEYLSQAINNIPFMDYRLVVATGLA